MRPLLGPRSLTFPKGCSRAEGEILLREWLEQIAADQRRCVVTDALTHEIDRLDSVDALDTAIDQARR